MTENLENPSFNFSIQDTMERGMGSKELLDGLYSAETATSLPDEIRIIEKKVKEKPKEAEKPPKQEKEETEKPKVNHLENLLSGEEEEEEIKDPPEASGEATPEGKEEGKEENRFAALAKDLFKLGVFSKEEEEGEIDISTPEDFLERFNYEKKKGAMEVVDRFIGQFGEDYQNAFDSIFVKGVNPKDYFGAFNNITDFAALDLTVETNQISVIKQTLADQGMEPEDITAEVERIKGYGDLEDIAKRYHKGLVKKEAAKIAKLEQDSQSRIEQQVAIKTQFAKKVQNVLEDKLKNKEFDGIPLSLATARELQDFLVTDKYKTPSGETLTQFDRDILDLKRPENHEKKVKIALLLKILEKDPTLSTIHQTGITKKTDSLFSELARQTGKSSVKTEKTTSKPASWFAN